MDRGDKMVRRERWYIWWKSYWSPEVRGLLLSAPKFNSALSRFKVIMQYYRIPKDKIEKACKTLRKNKVAQVNGVVYRIVKSNLSPLEFREKISKNVMWKL